MKAPTLFAIVVGVIVGFLLGGMTPRRELRDAEDKIADLQKELADARTRGGGGRQSPPAFPFPFPDVGSRQMPPPPSGTPRAGGAEEADAADEEARRFEADEARRAFALASDAQRMRARQSRQALLEKARLSGREIEAVERIVGDMNARLKEYADEMADMVVSGEEPDPRELLELTHGVSGVLLESQRAFEEQVGGDMALLDESSQQIWNYVDLETFREAFERAAEAEAR